MSTVWILGAGFSRSLDGPLFETLFGPWLMARLEAHFPPTDFPALYGTAAEVAHFLYNFGRRFSLGRAAAWHRESGETGEQLWQDAEEYLHTLDVAASDPNSPSAKQLGRLVHTHLNRTRGPEYPQPNLFEINGAARRLLAAECSAFMRTLDLNFEPAIPYAAWARRLGSNDTIITFNYDCLLEKLGGKSGKIDCVVPDDRPSPPAVVSAYKLHGSVNWLFEDVVNREPERVEHPPDDFAAVRCHRHVRLVMGSPGVTKPKIAKRLADLIWAPARAALLEASAIVFVGYRFPPTDAYAQKFLLDAIEENKSPYLAAHVILGPNSPAIVRVRQLLALALAARAEAPFQWEPPSAEFRSCNLRVWPLYAADFLGRAKEEQIARPFRFRDFTS